MRHAESAANAAHAAADDVTFRDAQLTAVGCMQAAAWRLAASAWGVEQIYVSPLRRALQTAAIAFTHGDARFVVCRTLRETHWSHQQNRGTAWAGLEPWLQRPEVFGRVEGGPGRLHPNVTKLAGASAVWDPAGEDVLGTEEVESRGRETIESARRWVHEEAKGKRDVVAMVTHYGVIQALFGCAVGNAAVLRVVYNLDGSIRSVEEMKPLR